jgi:hypothetical protein
VIRLLPLILFSLTSLIAAAAPSIQLPLDGYYRPGSYMPVLISTPTPILLDASPGMTTTVPAIDNKIVPLFVLSSTADHLQCGEISSPLHSLSDDQKLIGVTSHDDVLLTQLFPSKKIVQIDLNPSAPLPGPAIAWNSLDAIIVDSIDQKQLPQLLAIGMTIAVRSDAKPDTTWPWQRLAGAWVLRPSLSPNHPGSMGESAYDPVDFWSPGGHSAQARELIVLLALLLSCLMLAITLWRSRWMLPALAIFVAIFCIGFQLWRSRQSEVNTLIQTNRLIGEMMKLDRWSYQTAPLASSTEMKFDDCTWPVFASTAHADSLHATLECDATGQPLKIKYDLPAKAKMAFLTRSITP